MGGAGAVADNGGEVSGVDPHSAAVDVHPITTSLPPLPPSSSSLAASAIGGGQGSAAFPFPSSPSTVDSVTAASLASSPSDDGGGGRAKRSKRRGGGGQTTTALSTVDLPSASQKGDDRGEGWEESSPLPPPSSSSQTMADSSVANTGEGRTASPLPPSSSSSQSSTPAVLHSSLHPASGGGGSASLVEEVLPSSSSSTPLSVPSVPSLNGAARGYIGYVYWKHFIPPTSPSTSPPYRLPKRGLPFHTELVPSIPTLFFKIFLLLSDVYWPSHRRSLYALMDKKLLKPTGHTVTAPPSLHVPGHPLPSHLPLGPS